MSIKPETIPVDTDYPLSPTRAFYIQHNKATTSVFSLTDSLPLVYSHANGSDVEKGHALATETPSPPIVYTMKRENFFGTHLVARDEDGKDIAEWKSPFISLYAGTTKIKFLENVDGEETKGTEIKVKPASFLKRAEIFVKDGTSYIWEFEPHHHEHKTLYKVIDMPAPAQPPKQQKMAIAVYTQPGSHNSDGLLVLDAKEIDELLCVLTLCAFLEAPKREQHPDTLGGGAFLL